MVNTVVEKTARGEGGGGGGGGGGGREGEKEGGMEGVEERRNILISVSIVFRALHSVEHRNNTEANCLQVVTYKHSNIVQ